MTAAQREALDRLDLVLNRPALRAEFSLEPGQVYFINNRWILHNRTAFEDDPEPERRRHLVRLWLEAGNGPGPAPSRRDRGRPGGAISHDGIKGGDAGFGRGRRRVVTWIKRTHCLRSEVLSRICFTRHAFYTQCRHNFSE